VYADQTSRACDRRALIRRHSWKTSLWRLQRSTLVHRDCSHPEDRLVPRRHGADRVEGFSCRSYTVACAHTRAYHARCTTRSSFFFSQFHGEVTQRSGDVSKLSSCLRELILPPWHYRGLFVTLCYRRKWIALTIAHATQFTLYLFDIFYSVLYFDGIIISS